MLLGGRIEAEEDQSQSLKISSPSKNSQTTPE